MMNKDDALIARSRAQSWLDSSVDAETRSAIQTLMLRGNEEELINRFYKRLSFGTGGLRGIMGVGANNINRYTMGAATQGLSNYLKNRHANKNIRVAIAYDSRHNSTAYAKLSAEIFTANGINTYLYDKPMPTPLLSFAIRHLGCDAGVVITASHNPKIYNGYKVYGSDGAQLLSPNDREVMNEINAITDFKDIKFSPESSKIFMVPQAVEDAYLEHVKKNLNIFSSSIKKQHTIPLAYSSLHGTGSVIIPHCLSYMGFSKCMTTTSQSIPNGDFPTVCSPNPEEPEAMEQVIALARRTNAMLAMATDPDADRVGVAIRNDQTGEYMLLNGNQAFSLLTDYMLRYGKAKEGYILKTIVTTDLIDAISSDRKVPCYSTLTGFKYMAAEIKKREGLEEFIVAGEESYGFLTGDYVRDKDGVAACAFFAAMAATAQDKGESLYQRLLQLYIRYGLYREKLVTIEKKGSRGAEQIKRVMQYFAEISPMQLGGEKVRFVLDYEKGIKKDMFSGTHAPLDLPQSSVLQFYTEQGSKISLRPSGTEPKIKLYLSVKDNLENTSQYNEMCVLLDKKIASIECFFVDTIAREQ